MCRIKIFFIFSFLLLLVFFAPRLSGFPYPSENSQFSDFTITHYPNTVFIQRSLQEDHQLPLWSPAILSGYPISANPLSGMWYPPNWLTWLLPLPLGMNLMVILHLMWGGAGMYQLLAKTGRSMPASLLGASGFALMPKLIAHFGAGHIGLIQAVSWTPWLMLTSLPAQKNSRAVLAQYFPAVILALIFLADVRWIIYAGAAWLGWDLVCAKREKLTVDLFLHRTWRVVKIAGLALLLAGPLLVPFREYTALSTRSQLSAEESLVFSLPLESLIGFFVFDFSAGAHEWMIYPGAAGMLLALIGIISQARNRMALYWFLVCIASLIFSLGDHIPGMELLASLPGLSLLRVPSRAMFLVGFGINYLGAAGLDSIFAQKTRPNQRAFRLGILAWVAFVWALAGYIYFAKGGVSWSGWQHAMISGGIGFVLLWAASTGRESKQYYRFVPVVIILAGVLDLSLAASKMIYFKGAEQVFSERNTLAAWLADHTKGDYLRVYSPSYSVPQHQAAEYKLEMADGVDPLQLTRYVQFMETATGVPAEDYSVTLPAFANGDPKRANELYAPNARLLGLLNVKYLVSDFELPVSGIELVERIDGAFVYENQYFYQRAWIERSIGTAGDDREDVGLVETSPNQIVISAEGPGRLVLAEIFYPGWRVTVDGKRAEIDIYQNLLRSVSLEPGSHVVVFEYLPPTLVAGLAMQAVGSGVLAFLFLRRNKV